MTDPNDNDARAIAGTLPNPPPFWRSFTPENLDRMQKLRENTSVLTMTSNGVSARIPNVPKDLQYLQPPVEPADGKWRVFGMLYTLEDKLPTLEEQGMQRLGAPPVISPSSTTTHVDRALELKRIAKSLLLNFLELIGHLSLDPVGAEEKLRDLNILFINFHHVLNEYRPHQAREQVIALMQDRLDRLRGETARVNAQVDRARRALEGQGSVEVPEGVVERKKVSKSELVKRKSQEAWAAADALVFGDRELRV